MNGEEDKRLSEIAKNAKQRQRVSGHYSASKEPLRVVAFLGGFPRRVIGVPGIDWRGLNLDIKQGGSTIERVFGEFG